MTCIHMAQPEEAQGGSYNLGLLRSARTFLDQAIQLDEGNEAAQAFLRKVRRDNLSLGHVDLTIK